MDFGERHPGIDSVITVVDKPIQWVMGGIQVVLGLLFIIACCIFLPIYGYLRGPANRADAVAYFSSTGEYGEDVIGHTGPQRMRDHTTVYTIDYSRPITTAQYTKLDENYNDITVDVKPSYLEYDAATSAVAERWRLRFPLPRAATDMVTGTLPTPVAMNKFVIATCRRIRGRHGRRTAGTSIGKSGRKVNQTEMRPMCGQRPQLGHCRTQSPDSRRVRARICCSRRISARLRWMPAL